MSHYILFADAQSCPLLKEYAISYFLLHKSVVLKSEHSKELRESGELLAEIMLLMDNQDDEMTVTELRKELDKRELDVDGSKAALDERLKVQKDRRLNIILCCMEKRPPVWPEYHPSPPLGTNLKRQICMKCV